MLKIGIFVISVPDDLAIRENDLPHYEWSINNLENRFQFSRDCLKEVYKDTQNEFFSVNYHFIACDRNKFKSDEWDDECIDCEESYFTGIYEKTYKAFKHYEDYDFYVRTNLSTYINYVKLYKKLKELDTEKPILTGTLWGNEYYLTVWGADFVYASGTSIVMNKLARDFFVEEGAGYVGHSEADDALITKIFYDSNNGFYFHEGLSNSYYHDWDWNKAFHFNFNDILKENYIFIRLKENLDSVKFKYTLNMLNKLRHK